MTITVKCISCTKKRQGGNILFELTPLDLPNGFLLLGKFIKGKCPKCGTEIIIGVDD